MDGPVSLTSDLKIPKAPVGSWARSRFPRVRDLYGELRAASQPHLVKPSGWGDGRDQRWSWSGTACDTMLRWQLGDRDPSEPARNGGWALLGDGLAGTALDRLMQQPADLDDLQHAARVAVVWAFAEQHYRYGATENPLTPLATAPEDRLLAAVPDEVVEDVAAVAEVSAQRLVAPIEDLGQVLTGPSFAYRGGADADVIAGSTLIEFKTTVSRVGLVDVLQPIGYALLADPGRVDHLAWVFPRAGKVHRLALDAVLCRTCEPPTPSIDVLREELSRHSRSRG